MFINNQQFTKVIKREIKKFLETSNNENTAQNLWDKAKAVLRGKFIAVQFYLKKQEKLRIDNLTLHLNNWKKKNKTPQNQKKERNHKDQSRNK